MPKVWFFLLFFVRDSKRPVRRMPNCNLPVDGCKGRVHAASGSVAGESRHPSQKLVVFQWYPFLTERVIYLRYDHLRWMICAFGIWRNGYYIIFAVQIYHSALGVYHVAPAIYHCFCESSNSYAKLPNISFSKKHLRTLKVSRGVFHILLISVFSI